MKVILEGRDRIPQVRFLEALTSAGLLSTDVIWEEIGDKVILHVKDDPKFDRRTVFERKRFRVIPEKCRFCRGDETATACECV